MSLHHLLHDEMMAARRSKLQQVDLDLGSAHLELAREETTESTGLRNPVALRGD